MLRELLPKLLAFALLIASVFPAALVVQAGLAVDLFIQRAPAPRTTLLKGYRTLNGAITIGAALFLFAAALGALYAARKVLMTPENMTVPEGYQPAPH